LLTCILLEIDTGSDRSVAHEDLRKFVLLAHPIHETQIRSFDSDVNENLSYHIKKAVIDCDTVVALNASDFERKLFIVSDHSKNLFSIPIPTFELD